MATSTCPICMSTAMAPIRTPCNHIFCLGCLQSHLSFIATSIRTFPPPCPQCRFPLNSFFCLQIMQHHPNLAKLEALILEREHHNNIRYCANSHCAHPFDFETTNIASCADPLKVACPFCKHDTCVSCRSAWHDGSCNGVSPDMQNLTQEQGWQKCPKCATLVEKPPYDCHFMRCLCGTGFCYRCGGAYSSLQPSGMNNHGTPSCQCFLFEGVPGINALAAHNIHNDVVDIVDEHPLQQLLPQNWRAVPADAEQNGAQRLLVEVERGVPVPLRALQLGLNVALRVMVDPFGINGPLLWPNGLVGNFGQVRGNPMNWEGMAQHGNMQGGVWQGVRVEHRLRRNDAMIPGHHVPHFPVHMPHPHPYQPMPMPQQQWPALMHYVPGMHGQPIPMQPMQAVNMNYAPQQDAARFHVGADPLPMQMVHQPMGFNIPHMQPLAVPHPHMPQPLMPYHPMPHPQVADPFAMNMLGAALPPHGMGHQQVARQAVPQGPMNSQMMQARGDPSDDQVTRAGERQENQDANRGNDAHREDSGSAPQEDDQRPAQENVRPLPLPHDMRQRNRAQRARNNAVPVNFEQFPVIATRVDHNGRALRFTAQDADGVVPAGGDIGDLRVVGLGLARGVGAQLVNGNHQAVNRADGGREGADGPNEEGAPAENEGGGDRGAVVDDDGEGPNNGGAPAPPQRHFDAFFVELVPFQY